MNRIIFGDIHGFFDEMMLMLDLIQPTSNDQIYFLGDLIDRGPKSNEVLEFVSQNDFPTVLGNHEEILLSALAGPSSLADKWRAVGGEATLKSFGTHDKPGSLEDLRKYENWLQARPLYLDLGDLFLVHAGVNPDKPFDQQEVQDFCWIREEFHEATHPYFPDKTIIAGHTPTFLLGIGGGKLASGPQWINIDTGVYSHKSGWLSAIHWEKQKVYQVNARTKEHRVINLTAACVPIHRLRLSS